MKPSCNVFSFPLNQRSMAGELSFPSAEECDSSVTPTRHVTVPVTFLDVMQYRQVFKSALRGRCFTLCVTLQKTYPRADWFKIVFLFKNYIMRSRFL